MYRLILLDADDTLFDFGRAEKAALELTLTDLGYRGDLGHARITYHDINRRLWADLEAGKTSNQALRVDRFRLLFETLDLDFPIDKASQAFVGHLARGSFLLPGAAEVCQALAATCTLVIVTNGMQAVQRQRFEASAIRPWVSDLVISEEVGISKPDPRIFATALSRAGHSDKATVLMVGDSLTSDIRGGQNFGIDTCWYNPRGEPVPPGAPPTYTIERLDELLSLVR